KYHLLPPDDGDSDDEDEDGAKAKKTKKEEKEEKPVPESKLHPKVQELMGLIFNTSMMNRQMKELDYDADKMPLGKLAKATILHGYEVLKKISVALNAKKPNESELSELSSEFYTVIPHNFGFAIPPIIKDAQTLKKKLEMLEALGEIEIAQKLMKENKKAEEALTMNPLDQQFISLKLNKLEPMDKESERYKLIEQYVKNTHGSTHYTKLAIDEVFDLSRQGEDERFDESGFSKLHNRRLLWHGSRLTNYVGILSQGLRIAPPEAPVSGYMFDKGAYFADCVSKSANYCFVDSRTNNTGLMLLCEVALGDMYELEQSDYNAKANSQKAGKQSTKGLGLAYPDEKHDVFIEDNLLVPVGPLKRKKAGTGLYCLQYNEYIVYNTSQIKMRYLIRMKFGHAQMTWAGKTIYGFLIFFALAINLVHADEHSHKYTDYEEVVVWANSVGPLSNRQETYEYFQLPYCKGDGKIEHRHETLGEALLGMELVNSGISIRFGQNKDITPICSQKQLTPQDVKTFQYAISHDYWFQYFIDDLPVWGNFIAINN
ncbi:Poly [ADP-ribose] polymerase 2, partial [Lobosporangium transversale]